MNKITSFSQGVKSLIKWKQFKEEFASLLWGVCNNLDKDKRNYDVKQNLIMLENKSCVPWECKGRRQNPELAGLGKASLEVESKT